MDSRYKILLLILVQIGFAIWMFQQPGYNYLFLAYALACLMGFWALDAIRFGLRNSKPPIFQLTANDALLGLDDQGRIRFVNAQAESLLGFKAETLLNHPLGALTADSRQANHVRKLIANGKPQRGELTLQTASQKRISTLFSCVPLSPNDELRYLITFQDRSTARHTQDMLQQAAAVFEHTLEGIMITDADGIITHVNPAFTRISGYSIDEVRGQNPRFRQSGRHAEDFYAKLWERLHFQDNWQGEIWNKRKNGEIYPEWMNLSVIRDELGAIQHYIGVFSDISSIKEGERQLRHMATHDHLTQLPNRMLLLDRLSHALARAKREGNQLGVLFLDLDRFKQINDGLGHAVGDQLLIETARRIGDLLRSQDTIARLGGDEFVVLLERPESDTAMAKVAEKIIAALNAPFHIDGHELVIGSSIGVSRYPKDGHSVEDLMRNADCAMYRAKQNGKGRIEFYAPGLAIQAQRSLKMEEELRQALSKDQLFLVYQPQIELESGRLIGAEALLRWMHPSHGLIAPAHLIPLAEETGLIHDLGRWVLNQACQDLPHLANHFDTNFKLSINLSDHQLKQPEFASEVIAHLRQHRLRSCQLEFEIRESSLLAQEGPTHGNIRALHQHGITFALDDFGTGFLSLHHLQRLPVRRLKIDQSYILDLVDNDNSQAVVGAMIALSQSLDLLVVAEGVESGQQLEYLRKAGCHGVQGYYLGEPLRQGDFLKAHPDAQSVLTALFCPKELSLAD